MEPGGGFVEPSGVGLVFDGVFFEDVFDVFLVALTPEKEEFAGELAGELEVEEGLTPLVFPPIAAD